MAQYVTGTPCWVQAGPALGMFELLANTAAPPLEHGRLSKAGTGTGELLKTTLCDSVAFSDRILTADELLLLELQRYCYQLTS